MINRGDMIKAEHRKDITIGTVFRSGSSYFQVIDIGNGQYTIKEAGKLDKSVRVSFETIVGYQYCCTFTENLM